MNKSTIILLERVPKLGEMGDIVKVAYGYARNFLLPTRKALRATKDNLARFERERAWLESRNLELKKEASAVAVKLAGTSFIAQRQASDAGHLYGSVTARDIAELVNAGGFSLTRKQILLDGKIKTLGEHHVRIQLHPEVEVGVHVNVARTIEEADLQDKWLARVSQMKGIDKRSQALLRGHKNDRLTQQGNFDEALRIRREEQLPVYKRPVDAHSYAVAIERDSNAPFAVGHGNVIGTDKDSQTGETGKGVPDPKHLDIDAHSRRKLNAWISNSQPKVHEAFCVSINIGGDAKDAAAASIEFPEPDWSGAEFLDLVVSVSCLDCTVKPSWQELQLPRKSDSKKIDFSVTSRKAGRREFTVRVYLAKQMIQLQSLRFTVTVAEAHTQLAEAV